MPGVESGPLRSEFVPHIRRGIFFPVMLLIAARGLPRISMRLLALKIFTRLNFLSTKRQASAVSSHVSICGGLVSAEKVSVRDVGFRMTSC